MSKLASAARQLRRQGFRPTFDYALHQVSEEWNERRLDIHTTEMVDSRSLGYENSANLPYWPIPYAGFHAMMRHVTVDPGRDVLVDFGAGKGRSTILAARYPFKRIVGVELNPGLVAEARGNIERARRHLKCKRVDVVQADATEFRLDDDVTMLHLYNPFMGDVLRRVFANIQSALAGHQRQVQMLFANPANFEEILGNWDWISGREDVLWPHFPRVDPHANRYRIYRLRPPERADHP